MPSLRQISVLPTWLLFAAALGLGYIAFAFQSDTAARREALSEAMAAAPPAPLSLSGFDPATDTAPGGEVRLRGQLVRGWTAELTDTRLGSPFRRMLFVLIGPDETGTARLARAAILVDQSDAARMLDIFAEATSGQGPAGPLVEVSGLVERLPDMHEQVDAALWRNRVIRAPDFVFVAPFLNGRAAALDQAVPPPSSLGALALVLALGMLTLAILRLRLGAAPPATPARPVPDLPGPAVDGTAAAVPARGGEAYRAALKAQLEGTPALALAAARRRQGGEPAEAAAGAGGDAVTPRRPGASMTAKARRLRRKARLRAAGRA